MAKLSGVVSIYRPCELVLVGKCDGVDEEIERIPFAPELGKGCIERPLFGDIAIDDRRRIERRDQRNNALLEGLALIGEREFCAGLMQRRRDAPGNGAIVRDAHDEAPFAFHEAACRHGLLLERRTGIPVSATVLCQRNQGHRYNGRPPRFVTHPSSNPGQCLTQFRPRVVVGFPLRDEFLESVVALLRQRHHKLDVEVTGGFAA